MNAFSMSCITNFKKETGKICYALLLMLACLMLAGCPPDISDQNLKIEEVTTESVTLSWKAASDKKRHSMLYRVYRSSSPNLNSVSEIESNGTPWNDYASHLTSAKITGLEQGTKYYFNVIVKCAKDGDKRTYQMTETTTVMPLTKGKFYIDRLSSDSIAVNWTHPPNQSSPSSIRYQLSYSTDGANYVPVNQDYLAKSDAPKKVQGLEPNTVYYLKRSYALHGMRGNRLF